MVVESKLADYAKNALLAAAERLSPEQRLDAFLQHSRFMAELRAAGGRLNRPPRQPPS